MARAVGCPSGCLPITVSCCVSSGPQRQHHQPSRRELVQQSLRRLLGGSCHQDLVKGSMLCPAARSVANPDGDIAIAKLMQARLGMAGKLLNHFHGPDLASKLGQDGRLVAETCADLEHSLMRLQVQQVRHQGADEGLRHCLVEADRQRCVLVGDGCKLWWDKEMAEL